MTERALFPPARVVSLGGVARLTFCSGVTVHGSVGDQTRKWFGRIERALAREVARLDNLPKIISSLFVIRRYDGFNEARQSGHLRPDGPPASTCIASAQLASTDECIEIEAIAVLLGAS
jgi:enamine deaminase RidA (YjgF/YER057c/UK114 family)